MLSQHKKSSPAFIQGRRLGAQIAPTFQEVTSEFSEDEVVEMAMGFLEYISELSAEDLLGE
jgi:hypothetical protein